MMKLLLYGVLLMIMCGLALGASLTCQQISATTLSIPQFSSKTIEISCTASGGSVNSISITPNANPAVGLDLTNSQTISATLSDGSSGSAKWTVTGNTPNDYTVSYTITSDGTNSWTGSSTTSVDVTSPAQLTVEYSLPPSVFTPVVETLDIKISNIGGSTANNIKLQLNNNSKVDYPSTIAAGASGSFSWTNSTGFNTSGTYTTGVYIGDVFHDNATETVYTASEALNQTLGWNLISVPREQSDYSPAAVFSDISSSLEILWRYDGGNVWKSYDGPNGAPDTITAIELDRGYWLKTDSNVSLNFTGNVPDQVNISLAEGWNLVGYPKGEVTAINETLSSILSNLEIVWEYNGGVDWDSYDGPGGSVDTLTTMTPGKGYWIKMTTADTLVITN